MERIQRWTFSRTARGCITWYSLSESQGSPSPLGAFVRMDTRHAYLQTDTIPCHSVCLGKHSIFSPILFPLTLAPRVTDNPHNCLQQPFYRASSQGHTISLSCGAFRACSCTGSLTVELQVSWKCLRKQWGFCKNLGKNRAHPWQASLIQSIFPSSACIQNPTFVMHRWAQHQGWLGIGLVVIVVSFARDWSKGAFNRPRGFASSQKRGMWSVKPFCCPQEPPPILSTLIRVSCLEGCCVRM